MNELLPIFRNADCAQLAIQFEREFVLMPDTPVIRYLRYSFRPLPTPSELASDSDFCDFSLDFGVHSRCDEALREIVQGSISKRHRLNRIVKHSRKLTRNSNKNRAHAVL